MADARRQSPKLLQASQSGTPIWETVLRHPGSKRAFAKLENAGVRPSEFKQRLSRYLSASLISRWAIKWKAKSGKELHTLRRFPKRLRSMADEIEGVHAHDLLDPSKWMPILYENRAAKAKIEACSRDLHVLPDTLRFEADWLAAFLPIMRDAQRHRKAHGRNLRDQALFELLDYVRNTTGKALYGPLADLLTAALAVIGKDEAFDEDRLKVFYNRRAQCRKHATTISPNR